MPTSYWIPARIALGIRKPKHAILGAEFAGVIESTGKDVKRFAPGDQVFGSAFEHGFGTYAHLASDLAQAHALLMQFYDLLVARQAASSALLTDSFLLRQLGRGNGIKHREAAMVAGIR